MKFEIIDPEEDKDVLQVRLKVDEVGDMVLQATRFGKEWLVIAWITKDGIIKRQAYNLSELGLKIGK